MNFILLLFYIFSIITIASSLAVVTTRNTIYSVLFLILVFFNVSGLFILLNAEFLAMLLIIVYVGAIAVLFLFVVMMLNLGQRSRDQEKEWLPALTWFVPSVLALLLLIQLVASIPTASLNIEEIGARAVSELLFGPYVLAVELASFLLLAGLVSAYHIAKR